MISPILKAHLDACCKGGGSHLKGRPSPGPGPREGGRPLGLGWQACMWQEVRAVGSWICFESGADQAGHGQ